MTKVLLVDVDASTSHRISRLFPTVKAHHGEAIPSDAEVIFAGGESSQYLRLLAQVRKEHPDLPFVVIARDATTNTWLDALEAGATDYYHAPMEQHQLQWAMETIRLKCGKAGLQPASFIRVE